MEFIKNLVLTIEQETTLIETLISQGCLAVDANPNPRLGLVIETTDAVTSGTATVKKGDIVLDPADQTVFVATGAFKNGRPIVRNSQKVKTLEPEFVTVGASAEHPAIKKAAARLATQYADRRVLVYGALGFGKKKNVVESSSSNPVVNDKLPVKDPGIPAEFGSSWKEKKSKKGTTSDGSEVNNDEKPFVTWLKKSKMKEKKLGDCDPGNTPKDTK